MSLSELIEQIRMTPDCSVSDPAGLPLISEGHVLPDDLREFYELCGGLSLFENAEDYRIAIVLPEQVVLANPLIVGDVSGYDDISLSWYIIAQDDNNEYLTIDLSKERLGRCYDSFYEIHAVRGSCPIIATSF
jgi:hypothetical protein